MPMHYYELELPSDLAPEAFEKLMADEISPLVDTQPTRVGGIEGDSLFRSLEGGSRYVWGIEWGGLGDSFVGPRVAPALDALSKHDVEVHELVESEKAGAMR
jgi:hypothetical protein